MKRNNNFDVRNKRENTVLLTSTVKNLSLFII